MNAKWVIAAGYLLAVPLSVFAGADKTAVATRTDTPPVVDGHLTDRCWDLAVPTTDFILLDPVEGAPAANQTVVKILYTADQLYIGLFMADSNAENIDARVVPRDGRFAPRDLIGILLDTQHDHRNAYGFYINPYGIQHDFQMTDDGAKGYRGNNKGWDGVWRAEAAVLDSGWSAEVAIAFSTLSFAAGDDMVWGFNLERLAITGRERSHWAAIYQEDGSVLRVSKAGHLVGLRGIDPGLRLELLPYAASGVDRTRADWRGRDGRRGIGREIRRRCECDFGHNCESRLRTNRSRRGGDKPVPLSPFTKGKASVLRRKRGLSRQARVVLQPTDRRSGFRR